MATETEILKALTLLSAAYPNFNLNEETVRVYTRLLSDLDFEMLRAVTLQCASMNKFFPTVAELRAAAIELQSIADGIPSGIEAWGEVLGQISAVGSYGKPRFSHEIINTIVRQLGWTNLCLSENQIADRARFLDIYDDVVAVQKRRAQMLPEVRQAVDRRALEVSEQMRLLTQRLDVNSKKEAACLNS